jgi:uncharacterized iron-regulated membrane protein
VAIVSGAIWWWRSRRLDPAERERRRRLRLHRMGRIAEGRVVEVLNGSGLEIGAEELVVYNYEVRGVEYQAAQDVSFLRHKLELSGLASGRTASVKYDPQNPTNSIVLSEEWSGL